MTKLISTDDTNVFQIGINVFYYNQLADFWADELHEFFTRLTIEEIRDLREGDVVWIDQGPYGMGKVYGYTKTKISGIDIFGDGSIRVGVYPFGFTILTKEGIGRFIMHVRNERGLKNTLNQLSHFATQLR